MRQQLEKHEAKAVVSRNSRFETGGEITVTMTAEMASWFLGYIGQVVPSKQGNADRRICLYGGYYKPVLGALENAGVLDKEFRAAGAECARQQWP